MKSREPIADQRVGYDMFAEMVQHSPALWTVYPGIVCQGRTLPTREQAILDYMSIPTYYAYRDERGHSVMGEPHYPTREEAERSIGSYGLRKGAAA